MKRIRNTTEKQRFDLNIDIAEPEPFEAVSFSLPDPAPANQRPAKNHRKNNIIQKLDFFTVNT